MQACVHVCVHACACVCLWAWRPGQRWQQALLSAPWPTPWPSPGSRLSRAPSPHGHPRAVDGRNLSPAQDWGSSFFLHRNLGSRSHTP